MNNLGCDIKKGVEFSIANRAVKSVVYFFKSFFGFQKKLTKLHIICGNIVGKKTLCHQLAISDSFKFLSFDYFFGHELHLEELIEHAEVYSSNCFVVIIDLSLFLTLNIFSIHLELVFFGAASDVDTGTHFHKLHLRRVVSL